MPFNTLPDIGSLYDPLWNGIPWSQPIPGGPVFPAQQIGVEYEFEPTPGSIIWSENSGLWVLGCGHWQNAMTIFQGWDAINNISAAILACSVCSYVQRIIEPYDEISNPNSYPIILP